MSDDQVTFTLYHVVFSVFVVVIIIVNINVVVIAIVIVIIIVIVFTRQPGQFLGSRLNYLHATPLNFVTKPISFDL